MPKLWVYKACPWKKRNCFKWADLILTQCCILQKIILIMQHPQKKLLTENHSSVLFYYVWNGKSSQRNQKSWKSKSSPSCLIDLFFTFHLTSNKILLQTFNLSQRYMNSKLLCFGHKQIPGSKLRWISSWFGQQLKGKAANQAAFIDWFKAVTLKKRK